MANKPKDQKRTDPEIEALKGAYADGERSKQVEVDALKDKAEAAPWLFKMAGKIETTSFFRSQSEFFRLVMLKQVKDAKEYREKYGMTWAQFCEAVKVDRRRIDEELADLKPFKSDFLADFANFAGVEFNQIKYLGQAILAKTAKIEGDRLLFDGEAIPFEPEAVQAVIEKIQEDLKKEQEEHAAEKKTHERRMADEKKHIAKLEHEIKKYERHAGDKEMTAEEDSFLQRIENLRIGFTGYMLKVDPERMDDLGKENNPTVRMKSEYIALLHGMRSQINAAYDTAAEMYGDPTMLPEDSWHPGMK